MQRDAVTSFVFQRPLWLLGRSRNFRQEAAGNSRREGTVTEPQGQQHSEK